MLKSTCNDNLPPADILCAPPPAKLGSPFKPLIPVRSSRYDKKILELKYCIV